MSSRGDTEGPLRRLEDWEGFVEVRHPAPGEKAREDYRNYDSPARDTVRDFYRLNHRHQTYDYVRETKREVFGLDRRRMTVLEALVFLDALVDDSDPVTAARRVHRAGGPGLSPGSHRREPVPRSILEAKGASSRVVPQRAGPPQRHPR